MRSWWNLSTVVSSLVYMFTTLPIIRSLCRCSLVILTLFSGTVELYGSWTCHLMIQRQKVLPLYVSESNEERNDPIGPSSRNCPSQAVAMETGKHTGGVSHVILEAAICLIMSETQKSLTVTDWKQTGFPETNMSRTVENQSQKKWSGHVTCRCCRNLSPSFSANGSASFSANVFASASANESVKTSKVAVTN